MHFHLDGVFSPLAGLLAWAGESAAPIPALLFLTGLVGGFAHCGAMCGPFVLSQAAAVPGGPPVLRRLAAGLLLPYHLGRLVTYSGLGAAAASLGAAIIAAAPVRMAFAMLLLAAALLFALHAAVRLVPALPEGRPAALAIGWAGGLARLSRGLLDDPWPASRFALGVVLGFLPCGFLYGALAAAAATHSPALGAAAMAAFGLGTMPSLFLVGIGGASVAARWRSLARRALAPLFLFNAAVLAALAVSLAASP